MGAPASTPLCAFPIATLCFLDPGVAVVIAIAAFSTFPRLVGVIAVSTILSASSAAFTTLRSTATALAAAFTSFGSTALVVDSEAVGEIGVVALEDLFNGLQASVRHAHASARQETGAIGMRGWIAEYSVIGVIRDGAHGQNQR